MSTVSAPESRSAALAAARDPLVIVHPRREVPTPFYTRHMLGAIEAERDRRRESRGTHRRHTRGRTAMAHPRLDAASAAERRRLAQVRAHYRRWAYEGARYHP